MSPDDGPANAQGDEIRFVQLVAMFQMAAMQQMGKLVNPVTNEIEKDLAQAKASIDMIEMLKRRSEGNRSAAETEFLDKVLFELHMNYVDEAGRPDEESKAREAREGAEESDAAAEGESDKAGDGGGTPSDEASDPDEK